MVPHVQDDFDIPEEDLKSLDPRDQEENQACTNNGMLNMLSINLRWYETQQRKMEGKH